MKMKNGITNYEIRESDVNDMRSKIGDTISDGAQRVVSVFKKDSKWYACVKDLPLLNES